jgi:hypothetical protein
MKETPSAARSFHHHRGLNYFHGLWVCIKALLHSFEQMLMLPSWNPSLRPCRALRFERTFLTGCGPVAPYPVNEQE